MWKYSECKTMDTKMADGYILYCKLSSVKYYYTEIKDRKHIENFPTSLTCRQAR